MSTCDVKLVFPCAVRRLHIRVRDGQWEVVGETVIPSKTLPPSLRLPATASDQGILGAWYEAIDAQGETIYRQGTDSPLRSDIEYVGDDGRPRVFRAPLKEALLTVMIPDLTEVVAVRFFTSDSEPIRINAQTGAAESKPAAVIPARRQ